MYDLTMHIAVQIEANLFGCSSIVTQNMLVGIHIMSLLISLVNWAFYWNSSMILVNSTILPVTTIYTSIMHSNRFINEV